MNYARGFFRIWLLLTVGYAGMLYLLLQKDPHLNCLWDCDTRGSTRLAVLFGLPLIVLVVGRILGWVFLGFRR